MSAPQEISVKFVSVYCPLCKGGPHENREALIDHLHECQKVKCPLCCKAFRAVPNLIKHLQMPLCVIPQQIRSVDNLLVVNVKKDDDKKEESIQVKDLQIRTSINAVYNTSQTTDSIAVTPGKEKPRLLLPKPPQNQQRNKPILNNAVIFIETAKVQPQNTILSKQLTIEPGNVDLLKVEPEIDVTVPPVAKTLPEYIVTNEKSKTEVLKFWIKQDLLNDILEKLNELSCNDVANDEKYVTKKKRNTRIITKENDCIKCLRCSLRIGLNEVPKHFPVCERWKMRKLCGKCGRDDFINLRKAYGHYRTCSQTNTKDHTCFKCKKSYGAAASLRQHIFLVHQDKYPYPCEHCSSAFKRRHSLTNHMASAHKVGRKLCPFCGKDFTTGPQLSGHIRCMHTGELPYQCDFCGRKLARCEDLAMHRKRVEKGLQCPKVKIYNEVRDKNERYDFANSTLWRCHLCKRIFKPRDALISHIRAHFRNQLTEKCEECGSMFPSKKNVGIHMKKGHVPPKSDKKIQELPEDEITKLQHHSVDGYQCHMCEKIFLTKSHLFGHIKTHNKPFQCEKCPRKFSYKKYLDGHLRIHDDESEKFCCDGCGATFSIKRSLDSHLKCCLAAAVSCTPEPPEVTETYEIEYFTVA